MDETTEELAFFDFLAAREAMLAAAIGALMLDNVPVERLRIIETLSKDDTIRLAARVVLYRISRH